MNLAAVLSKKFKTPLLDCDPMASCLDFGNPRSEELSDKNTLSVCQKVFTLRYGSEMSGKAIRQKLKSFNDGWK